mmetsp:Transcript_35764/g.33896  ORF Transcript_35764/g.33896 Transcript_35764/m.33896 type:complete len:341 (-) Transcript_35764:71-1093(-)
MVEENLSASEELVRSLQYTSASKRCGVETIEKLLQQNEGLLAAEDTIEANEYILQKSMTILRGMTWPGMIYNTIFATDTVKNDSSNKNQIEGNINVQESDEKSSNLSDHQVTSQQPNVVDENEILKQLLSSVTELEVVGATMGCQIEQQNIILSKIDQKTERVGDQTLAVTLEASILSQRMRTYDGQVFLGTYQFIDENECFLSVMNENIMLTANEDRSTLFNCYAKDSTLYALQSAKTLKFLSATLWGLSGIQAVGGSFNRREECHMDLNKQNMGLFFLHSNFGYGGWLKRPGGGTDAGGIIVNTVTANVSDKVGILMLKPVLVKTDNQERCRRQDFVS